MTQAERSSETRFGYPNFDYHEHLRYNQLTHGVINIDGIINSGSAGLVHREVDIAANHSPKELVLYINSPGGVVSECIAIHDHIRILTDSSIHCTTVGVGFVASGACLLVLQAGDVRLSYPNTRYMLHEISRMLGGGPESQSESVDLVKEMRNTSDQILELFCKRTGVNLKRLTKAISRKNLYLSAQEALDWGIIDSIVGPPPAGVPCPGS